jgi:hypothetical protein
VEKKLILNILDKKRKAILPDLKVFKDDFYLGGGTGLALQLGHRKSYDFDFFTTRDFNINKLQHDLETIFKDHNVEILQLETHTLTILIDNDIKISFFKINNTPVIPLLHSEWFSICHELEIGAMKIAALLRAAYRDYVDIYFLLKKYALTEIMELCKQKYSSFEESVYIKALLSYDDIEITPIRYSAGFEKKTTEIFALIKNKTKKYLLNHIK